ncbi:MAG: ATP-binding protein [Bacteroidia bacterium]|nr:ATP-binding protein [Bacteroidia bacterium]MCX7652766.1 ATP-binding protein [Bacteroidia bacterium]MDW8417401.1 ATP-binding protein [Bacteroidia bacterium]
MSSPITSQGFFREEILSSDLDELLRAEPILTEVASMAGLSEERTPLFIVAVTEALSNAIVHGNRQQKDKVVRMRFSWSPETRTLTAEIQDEGTGFNPATLPDPTATENLLRESGRGIFLMRNLADSVEFQHNGTCVELKFYL